MLTTQTLIDDLAAGCKNKDHWRIGLEVERFAFRKKTGGSLPYEGENGIKALLMRFADSYGWLPVRENGHVIALKKDGAAVTLEPGGQVEYSGPPLKNLSELRAHYDGFYRDMQTAAEGLGIDFLACGFHPRWSREDIHIMPKERYEIMCDYMPTRGNLGIDMMLRTCGAQVNLDFDSEADMVKKFRVALAIQPVVTALMANSHLKEGKDTGYQSYRSYIWTDTDPDRCGILPFVFEERMGFARYVEYALDVPMYFIRRNGDYINVAGHSFRAFMEGKLPGHEGEYPAIEDWHDHLTTLFPEVRLKTYLELRGPDSGPPEMVYAMAAFWAGLLYDRDVLQEAWQLVSGWDVTDHERIRDDVTRCGLLTKIPDDQDLYELAEKTLDMAGRGLSEDDRSLLRPFYEKLFENSDAVKSPIGCGS